MTIQTSGDDHHISEAEQTSRDQFELWAKNFGAQPDLTRANSGANYADSVIDIAWMAWKSSRASIESHLPILLPSPITEADGYRLNTSWHSGAIFRDGANWMRDEVVKLQGEPAKPVSGRMMPRHEFSQMVNELRDIPAVQSKREKIVGVLRAFNIRPAEPEGPC